MAAAGALGDGTAAWGIEGVAAAVTAIVAAAELLGKAFVGADARGIRTRTQATVRPLNEVMSGKTSSC